MARKKPNPSLNPDLVRSVGLACILLLAIALFILGSASFLRSSPLFVVRDISMADSLQQLEIPELLKLRGQNIFYVDLAKIESRIRQKYPQLSNLHVMRRFPDQIFVMATQREPFAAVAFDNRICVIDRNGFMMGPPLKDQPPLAVIRGLKSQRVAPGDQVSDENVRLAIEIITLFHQDGRLPGFVLSSLHVNDPTRITCDIQKDGLEFQVIIDKEHRVQRLKTLSDVLTRGGLDLLQIKYMDLRFGEPVIGQKKVKK
ncbi:MAG: FtsQ-type POTRA domain-containing protein [Candidatus Omnitrophica bacterium]|nr:FtsQ-type POTRA domain-containing protein [Candidatus Omnitrophota bacterium]